MKAYVADAGVVPVIETRAQDASEDGVDTSVSSKLVLVHWEFHRQPADGRGFRANPILPSSRRLFDLARGVPF